MKTKNTAGKKEFINWIISRYQLKQRECLWILNEIGKNEEWLERVNFVDEASQFDNGLQMSVFQSENLAFKYYKNNVEITDPILMYEKVRANKEERMFIQIDFPNRKNTPNYLKVKLSKEAYEEMLKEEEKELEELMGEIIKQATRFRLEILIDKSLAEKNEKNFLKMTKMMKRLEQTP